MTLEAMQGWIIISKVLVPNNWNSLNLEHSLGVKNLCQDIFETFKLLLVYDILMFVSDKVV